MKLGLQDIEWGYVGARLAGDDDQAQAEFFIAFVRECLSWGTRHQVEIQLAEVNKKLTSDERKLLGMLSYSDEEDVS